MPVFEYITDFAASSVAFSASTVPMSGATAPRRMATPIEDLARSTRLPFCSTPLAIRPSIASAESTARSPVSPPTILSISMLVDA